MFTQKFKLICSAIGLVAVLVMGLAVPGATQQNPLSRQSVVDSLAKASATLTASEGDIFDTNAAMFYSDTVMTLGFIPQHPASRSLALIDDLLAGKAENVTLERLYVSEDILDRSGKPLIRKGLYTLKAVNATTIVFVDAEGTEVLRAPLHLRKLDSPLPTPTTNISIELIQDKKESDNLLDKVIVCFWVTVRRCWWFICWDTTVQVCGSVEVDKYTDQQPWVSTGTSIPMVVATTERLRGIRRSKSG